jgi:RNA polymerase sigma factor (sigma-70 family)
MGNLNDLGLVNEAGRGDAEAIAELFRRHHPAALRYARALSKSEAMADDLAADAFVRLLKRISEGARPNAVRPYLLTTVRHLFVDHLRRYPPTEDISDEARHSARLVSSDPAVDTVGRIAVESLLEALEPSHRRVLLLAIVDGFSNAEIAQVLDMTPSAAASLSYRARRALKRAYWATDPVVVGVPARGA